MNTLNDIIYDLLFSIEDDFYYDITDMLEEKDVYKDTIDRIIRSINKGNVYVVKDSIEVRGDDIFWKVKIKRQ